MARAAAPCFALLLIAALGWASLGELDVVASAEGRVVPVVRTKRVQPFESGFVRAIRVADGQHVRAGDVLIELDPTLRDADVERLANNLLRARADVARLAALREWPRAVPFVAPEGLDEGSSAAHLGLLQAEIAEHEALLAGLEHEIHRLGAQVRAVGAALERQRRVLPLVAERAAARRALADAGWGSRLAWLELEQQRVEREQDLAELRARLEQTRAEQAAARERRARVEAEFRRSVHARAIEAERIVVSLAQELAKAERHARFQTLTAPIDGTVQQLAVHTIGGVVAAGETLLLVVPENDGLEIECRILNRDVGFVVAGQAAQIKLEAFPYTIYGTVDGVVRDVGRDASEDPALGLVFPTLVRLARADLVVDGRRVPLAAGMRATVEIVTDRRRAIEYLLSPLLRLTSEAWRER